MCEPAHATTNPKSGLHLVGRSFEMRLGGRSLAFAQVIEAKVGYVGDRGPVP